MRVGILKDFSLEERAGGAQRAMHLFEKAAPPGVELVRILASSANLADSGCDAYFTGLVKTFPDNLLQELVDSKKPHMRYQFDLWQDSPNAAGWAKPLTELADVVMFPSPMYQKQFLAGWHIENKQNYIALAPPMDLEELKPHRVKWDNHPEGKKREGLCYFGECHPLKGVDIAIRWAANEGQKLDIYGPLSYQFPASPWAVYNGCPDQYTLYDAVASHEWLIHMPRQADGFSYSILEAMLLGLKVYASGKLGIESWLEVCTAGGFEELVEKCALAPNTFWELFERAAA